MQNIKNEVIFTDVLIEDICVENPALIFANKINKLIFNNVILTNI